MTTTEHERQRLGQIAQSAQAIGTHLSGILAAQTRPIHFRPSAHGITLVGLDPTCPQRGHGPYSAARLHDFYCEEYRRHCTTRPKRATPEKHLQSFLIGDAYQHGRQLATLRATVGEDPTTDMCFVTDELALHTSGGKKLVCDLLAIRRPADDPAAAIPVLIELKSSRHMARLVEQLTDFSQELHLYRHEFSQIASGLLGEKIRLAREPELWLVWLGLGSDLTTDPREAELGAQGIRVVQYARDGDNYRFHVGRRPAEVRD